MKTAIATVLVCLCAGAPAYAQDLPEAQKQEVYCVHDVLVARKQTALAAESYLNVTTADGVRGAADNAINAAASDCARKYGWDETLRGQALAIGVMGSTADFMASELKDAGVAEAAIEKVKGLLPGLSKRDRELLFDGAWSDDRAFMARMKTKLNAAGVSGDADVIHKAVVILECSVIGADSAGAFVEQRFG